MDPNDDEIPGNHPAAFSSQQASSAGMVAKEFVSLSITNPHHHLQGFADNYHLPAPPPPPPPAMMMANEGIIAFDITDKFLAAAATLEPGELIKDGHFTLFESVGALEIMDPKMDSGCLAPGESLYEDYDVTRPLLPREVLGIIDRLLSLEMAWHLGHPLSQTLFTNVYIDRILNIAPQSLQDADFISHSGTDRDPMHQVLRAYCLGLIKTCWYVNERIKLEHYYEEEDFVTNTYNRSLLDNIDADEIRDELMAARKIVHGLRHRITDEVANALGFRLELRTAFLRVIELAELRSDPDSLSLPWSQMQAVWEAIYNSRNLGVPVPEAFSAKIQRRLASTMPPRPIVELSPEETYKHFKKLIEDGIAVLDVLKYEDPQSLLNFVITFQAQKPQPMVYIRTLLQSFLFKDMVILGRLSIRHILDADLALLVLPSSRLLDPTNDLVEAPHHPSFAIAHQMELFRQRVAQSYLDIFRAFCQNRCRIRRTLFHSIQDWDTVQADAEEIDALLQLQLEEKPIIINDGTLEAEPLQSVPLASWAYLYKLRLMEWCVQLGFELEIYAADELAGMYWYLSSIARTRVQLIDRIKLFINSRHADYQANRPNPLTVSASSSETQFARCKTWLKQAYLDAAATAEFADSLSHLFVVLMREGKISPPPRPYGNPELRHHVRMKGFALIGLPAYPTVEEMQQATDNPNVSSQKMLELATAALAKVRKRLNELGDMGQERSFTFNCHARWKSSNRKVVMSVVGASSLIADLKARIFDGGDQEGGDGTTTNTATANAKRKWKVEVGKPTDWFHEWWVLPRFREEEDEEVGQQKEEWEDEKEKKKVEMEGEGEKE